MIFQITHFKAILDLLNLDVKLEAGLTLECTPLMLEISIVFNQLLRKEKKITIGLN